MKNRRIAERALWKAFIAALGLGAVAHAGLGYLPLTGPPPLRFQASKNLQAAVAQINLTADTNFAAALAATDAIGRPVTNTMTAFTETNSTFDMQPIALGAGNISDDPFAPGVLSLAPPDLLNITPQMLTAFFHPVPRGTNTSAVLSPVMFMPPQIKVPQPSSHAEYIVK
jgi:hypothetical protein